MSDEYAAAELAALIRADLMTSGARTAADIRDALISSTTSLMDAPEPHAQARSTGTNEIEITLMVEAPRWPGPRS